MKYYDWDSAKNLELKSERNIGFEDVLVVIDEGKVLDDLEHPNRKRYPNQRMFVIEISGYAYLVPYVEDEKKIFFKTIIPSRKATRKYIEGGSQ